MFEQRTPIERKIAQVVRVNGWSGCDAFVALYIIYVATINIYNIFLSHIE